MLYDTHCHLDYYLEDNSENLLKANDIQILNQIIQSCKDNGVELINTIGVEIDKFEKIYNISHVFKEVYCSIGQHPLYVAKNIIEDFILKIRFFLIREKQNIEKKIIAIGECGLDFFKIEQILEKEKYPLSVEKFKDLQVNYLQAQIEIAQEFNLPCIIHSRNAEEETYSIFKNAFYYNGVLHSFTGSKTFMKKMLDLGFFVSFSGIVTFKNALEIQENLKYCPLDRILIETDSPYLAPQPLRGQKNFPQNVSYVFEFAASLLQNKINSPDLKRTIFENSKNLFLK